MGTTLSQAAPVLPTAAVEKESPSNKDLVLKGIRTEVLGESDKKLPHLCLLLCQLVACPKHDSQGKAQLKSNLEALQWEIHGVEFFKVPSQFFKLRDKDKPCAMVGYLRHKQAIDAADIPFVVFRGQAVPDVSVAKSHAKYSPVPFITSKGYRIGKVHAGHRKAYLELRALQLIEWITGAAKSSLVKQVVITGHGVGGSLAVMLATELIVDNSKVDEALHLAAKGISAPLKYKVDDDAQGSFQGGSPGPHHSLGDLHGDSKFYLIAPLDLITFGSPRTFDTVTAQKLQKLSFHHRVARFIASGDVLPTLPHSDQGCHHIGHGAVFRPLTKTWVSYPDKSNLQCDRLVEVQTSIAGNALSVYVEQMHAEVTRHHEDSSSSGSDEDEEAEEEPV